MNANEASINEHQRLCTAACIWAIFESSEFWENYTIKLMKQRHISNSSNTGKATKHTNISFSFIVRCCFVDVDFGAVFSGCLFTLCKRSKWMWMWILLFFLSFSVSLALAPADIVPSHLLFVLSPELSVGRVCAIFFAHFIQRIEQREK